MNRQIAEATGEQNQVAEDIDQSIHRISDQVTDLAAHAKSRQQSVGQLVNISEEVRGLVGRFNI